MTRKISPSNAREINRRFLNGESLSQLAREFKCSTATIIRHTERLDPEEAQRRRLVGRAELLKDTLENRLRADAERIQKKYVSASAAAAELGIRRETLHEYLVAGKFPGAFQISDGGPWLVPRVSVAAYAERRKPRP